MSSSRDGDHTAHAGGHLHSLPPDDVRNGRHRYAGFVHPPEGVDPLDWVKCPAGHHVPRPALAQFPESGRYVCDYREPPGNGPRCKREILVLFVRRMSKDATGQPIRKVYVAEVDWREMQLLEAEGITDVFEMIAWLGEKYDPPKRSKAG
jgi:hypothetical protein